MPEVHLFVIWASAQKNITSLIGEIRAHFSILTHIDILWDLDLYESNMRRFYGIKLPNFLSKLNECGTGRFSLIVVRDETPFYDERKTSNGVQYVNAKMFDTKCQLRHMTGGGHKIHGTINNMESCRDLYLLCGLKSEELNFSSDEPGHDVEPIKLDANLLGAIQWDSLLQMFDALNRSSIPYVVLRNFECMPIMIYEGDHGDIDILVEDRGAVVSLLNAKKINYLPFRSCYRVAIAGRQIRMDIRCVGDNYYDSKWERAILRSRELYNGVWVPDKTNYAYSLIYHALYHKRYIAEDYVSKINSLGLDINETSLSNFLKKNNYACTDPKDLSVFYKGPGQRLIRKAYWALNLLIKSLIGYK